MIRNNINGMGNDSYCKLLLNGNVLTSRDGVAAPARQFYEASNGGGHLYSMISNNYVYPLPDSAIKKFGDNSWHFPASGGDIGILVTGQSTSDWEIEDKDFTLDAWMYGGGVTITPNVFIAGMYLDASTYWGLKYSTTDVVGELHLHFTVKIEGSILLDISYNYAVASSTFAHTAVVKDGSTITLYLNGNVMDSDTLATIPNINTNFKVGTFCGGACADSIFHIDEFRYSKGIARWLNDFTPPNRAY